MNPTGLAYNPDSIQPEYNLNFGLGGGTAPTLSGQVSNAPGAIGVAPACLTCPGGPLYGISWPVIIIALAVLVLAFRK